MAKRLKSRHKCPKGHLIAIGKANFCGTCRTMTRYRADPEFKSRLLKISSHYKATHREQVNAAIRKRYRRLKEQYQSSGFERWK